MTLPDKELFEFDSFRLDPAQHMLLRDGEPVPLEPKVFETLLALIQHGGLLVGKEELMRTVWPDSFVEESNLTRNISVLRKALNRSDGGPQYIETVPKRGYRFIGQVRALADDRAELIVQRAKVSVVVEEEESDGETNARYYRATPLDAGAEPGAAIEWKQQSFGKIKRHKLVVLLTLALLMSAVAAGVYFRAFDRSGPAIDSLAVLPFVNVGANPDTEYLSDGITDSLINNLSRLPKLKVMSRSSVFHYKGSETDAQQAGRTLGVRAVLTGKVMQRGNDLIISAELVDVRDNSHLWGEQYNQKFSDLPAVQAELARDISKKLRLQLSGEDQVRLTKRDTENAEAYELYLKGRYYQNALTPDGDKRSLEYFQLAIEKDPRYAPAYAGLAEYYAGVAYAVTTPSIPPKEAYSRAKAAALRAVELDDTLAEAHTSLGVIALLQEWDWEGAEREFSRAIALKPNYVNAHHWYSHYLIYRGRFAESLAESQHALALDPLDVGMNFHLGFHYYNARQYDQATAQLQKVLDLNPNYSEAHCILGLVYEQTGRLDEAIAELQKSTDLGGTDHRDVIGHMYALSGRRDEAQKLLAQLQEESKRKSVSPYNIAKIYEGLGEKDQAFLWLEKAYAERDSNLTNLKVEPEFDSLRSDSRFADLLRRMRIPQ
jgi:TolB-like protein/DNA-binding winged helix-turn-helix (wHTH) protein/Flp pilus assembly protein TadD